VSKMNRKDRKVPIAIGISLRSQRIGLQHLDFVNFANTLCATI